MQKIRTSLKTAFRRPFITASEASQISYWAVGDGQEAPTRIVLFRVVMVETEWCTLSTEVEDGIQSGLVLSDNGLQLVYSRLDLWTSGITLSVVSQRLAFSGERLTTETETETEDEGLVKVGRRRVCDQRSMRACLGTCKACCIERQKFSDVGFLITPLCRTETNRMRRYALGWSLVATKSRILILGSAFSKELLLNVDDKLNSEFRATQQKANERTDKYKLGRSLSKTL